MKYSKLLSTDLIKPFDCGDSDLNGFLFDDAIQYIHKRIAITYIIETEAETVAYFSLLNDRISQDMAPHNIWRKIKHLFPHRKHINSYPAVKIGRLAVSLNYKGSGIGTDILYLVKQMYTDNKNRAGCRFITVDAYKEAIPFYEKNGFRFLSEEDINRSTRLMYYDLMELS